MKIKPNYPNFDSGPNIGGGSNTSYNALQNLENLSTPQNLITLAVINITITWRVYVFIFY